MTAPDEQQLVREARDGSHAAFRVLVGRHMKRAYNIAYSFVGDHHHAEEVAQEAFVRAYLSLRSFRGEAEFGTWLYRIVTNLSLNRVKSNRRRAGREVRDTDAGISVPSTDSQAMETTDVTAHIERALHELPTLQRAVVILRHFDGLSTRQVSNILRCSEGTVKTHLFRGLKKLRSKLSYLEEKE